jgi:TPR repeat protein
MNVTLSQGRADALKAYIIKVLNLDSRQFNITAGAEDWNGLKSLVEKSDLADKAKVIEIIDTTPSQEKQAALKRLSGGKTYKTLLKSFYPQLRDACYINVWYSEKEDMVAETINTAIEDVNAKRYHEAIRKLLPYKDDSRTWNTLGSAYLLTDNLEEAKKWFEAAASTGDKEAVKNLEIMEKINH